MSANIFFSRGLSFAASLRIVQSRPRRQPGVDEVVRQVGTPLVETLPVQHVIAGVL